MNVAVFDLDGTLTDPKLGITQSIRYALSALGSKDPPETDLLWCIGPPLQHGFARLLGTSDPDRIAKAVALYRERFTDVGLLENQVYPGIPEALQALRESGTTLLVATSKPAVYAKRILDHFELASYFKAAYGSELDGRLTDKTELLEHLIKAEGIDPSGAIMVGDREHDMLAARNVGMHAVGVLYGYGSRDELLAAGGEHLCATPPDLPQAVLANFDDVEAEPPPIKQSGNLAIHNQKE